MAALPKPSPVNSMIKAGITGMIIPKPIVSNTTVMKMKESAALRGSFLAIRKNERRMYRDIHLIKKIYLSTLLVIPNLIRDLCLTRNQDADPEYFRDSMTYLHDQKTYYQRNT